MSVIAAYVYEEGRRVREVDLHDPASLELQPGQFAWIGLFEPGEAELDILKHRFDLHPLAVEDALKSDQLPKVDVYGDQLFVVARTAHLEGETIGYGETDIFVGPSHIITVRHGSARAHLELREHLEAAPAQLKHGVDFILHAVLDFIVDGYFPIVDAIEEKVLEMERYALDAFLSRTEVLRIFALRRELMRFKRVLGPMEEVASRLEHHEMPCIDWDVRPYFRDVYDHIRRVSSLVETLREQPDGTATPGRDHPAAGGLGCDPGGADGHRRDLRDELRVHAGTEVALRLSAGGDRHPGDLPGALCTVQAREMAVIVEPVVIPLDAERSVSGLWTLPPDARAALVLAHGAGAGMAHKAMNATAEGLAARGIATLRYNFLYMERGSKRPDSPALAHEAVRAAVAKAGELAPDLPLFAGGRSFGGRMTSQAQAERPLASVRGLVFFAFPLHPPGKPGVERAAHLAEIKVPMLFLQGTNDEFARLDLLDETVVGLGAQASLTLAQFADHSFHAPAKSGRKDPEVLAEILDACAVWMAAN